MRTCSIPTPQARLLKLLFREGAPASGAYGNQILDGDTIAEV